MNQYSLHGAYPRTRLRRTRSAEWSRRLVAETRLSVEDLIWPCFICEDGDEEDVASLPGVRRFRMAQLVEEAKTLADLGIPAIALFPCTSNSKKTPNGDEALNPHNLVCRAVRTLKKQVPSIGIICDVALDPYTTHGQDGLVDHGVVLNDATIDMLCKQAIVQAQAGCDVLAPSDMMDGRIGAIRDALDKAGFADVMILSYAVKYASCFYGPFRDAVGSANALGKADKRSYQLDPANAKEAMREAALDIQEGADMLMVKPGMPYLDILHSLTQHYDIPVLAYQVSGEYAMLRYAALAGAIDFVPAMLESLSACKRAGASAIFTYAAKEVADYLNMN
jgi:porphobilinogen synthase